MLAVDRMVDDELLFDVVGLHRHRGCCLLPWESEMFMHVACDLNDAHAQRFAFILGYASSSVQEVDGCGASSFQFFD